MSSDRPASVAPEPLTDVSNRLDPELRGVYDGLPPVVDAIDDPVGARRFRDERFAKLAGRQERSHPDIETIDLTIPRTRGRGGGDELELRLHRPRERDGALPAVAWLHGGGFTGGSARYEDGVCHQLVTGADLVAVAVEYRLLPDHPFPAAIEDTLEALSWLASADEAADLGVDRSRIAVAGLSAGGTLAAGAALRARDEGGPELAYQLLLYGSMDDRLDTPSSHEFQDRRSPYRAMAANTWAAYLGAVSGEPPAAAVPARAADLSGLPPAYVLVGEIELVRDENIVYAQRLLAAGVSTELHVVPGAFHGFDVLVPDASVARREREAFIGALRRALAADR